MHTYAYLPERETELFYIDKPHMKKMQRRKRDTASASDNWNVNKNRLL